MTQQGEKPGFACRDANKRSEEALEALEAFGGLVRMRQAKKRDIKTNFGGLGGLGWQLVRLGLTKDGAST